MANLKKINLDGVEHVLGIVDAATTAVAGLMSAADKTKLDGIDSQLASKTTAAQVQTIIDNNTNNFATKTEVNTAVTNGTKNLITSTDAQTMVNNATSGLVTTSAMNTAISNATSDKITSSQAQTIANNTVANYKLKGDFAKVTLQLTLADGTASNSTAIAYPSGFNHSNCMVISFMAKNHSTTATTTYGGYGYIESSVGYVSGAIGHRVMCRDDGLLISINNPTDGAHSSGTATYTCTILLMKI